MSRIALVAGPDPGHTIPVVALALALRDRGHDVVVATGQRWQAHLAREGLAAVEVPMLAADPRDADFGFRFWGRAEEMAPRLAGVLAPYEPELLAVDTLTTPGSYAAGLLGVPWVEVVPHLLQLPSRALPPIGSGLLPARWPHQQLRDRVLRFFTHRSLAEADAARRAGRRALGLPDDGPPAMRLVATLPGLEWRRPDWPADTHVVGALDWDPHVEALTPPPGDAPLVFVSDSTAWHRPVSLVQAVVESLASDDVRIVATSMTATGVANRDNVVTGTGRQSELLDACAVVVCAGGGGLLAKTLTRGKPVVVVPGPGDQRENGVRAQASGAGLVLRSDASNDAIGSAVRRVLAEPQFAAAARRLADEAKALGPDYAAALVESVLS